MPTTDAGANGLPAILFAANVPHAEGLANGLKGAAIASETISGTVPPAAAREKALSGLRRGSVKVLCAADLISEGLDVPAVGAVILLRPTKSLALYLQQVGRGLRPAPGKDALVVLDHAGNSLAHGLPDAPRRWVLDAGLARGARKARMTKGICTGCASSLRRGATACRSCGAEIVAVEPSPHVALEASVLREVTVADAARRNALISAPVRDLLRDARTVSDLVAIQRVRGFKPGWVWHQWQAMTGERSDRA